MNKKHKNPTCVAWVQSNQQPRHRAQTRGGRIGQTKVYVYTNT